MWIECFLNECFMVFTFLDTVLYKEHLQWAKVVWFGLLIYWSFDHAEQWKGCSFVGDPITRKIWRRQWPVFMGAAAAAAAAQGDQIILVCAAAAAAAAADGRLQWTMATTSGVNSQMLWFWTTTTRFKEQRMQITYL